MSRADRVVAPAPHWRVSIAVGLAIPLAFAGYGAVLRGGDWWGAIAVTSTLVLGSATVTRAVLAERFGRLGTILPSIVGAAVAAVVISLASVAHTTVWGLPTWGTLGAVNRLVAAGVESLAAQEAPALADPGVVLVFSLGAAALAVLCDLAAVALRRPALTGLLLLPAAVVPAFVVDIDGVGWVVLAAIAWMLVLVASRPARGRYGGQVAAVLATAVAAALLVTVLVPLPSGRQAQGSGPGSSIRSGVNPVVTLGEDLRREETITALVYSTLSGDGRYLRLTALDTLTEEGWTAQEPPDGLEGSRADDAPVPFGLGDGVAREVDVASVSVRALGGAWVPAPYPAVAVENLTAPAAWDDGVHALRTEGRSVRGEEYEVESLVIQPTAQQLQDAGTTVPDALLPLAGSDASWPTIIADTAASVTAGMTSNYERALALQSHLREEGGFEYSELAPQSGGYDDTSAGAVAAFLQERSGYCVQFASGMALMARTLGIPSRLALGFLPGESSGSETPDSSRLWVVTSDELHAWPELYFEGVGWVPFEPTATRGAPADYAEQRALDALREDTPQPTDAAAAPAPSSAPGGAERRDPGDAGAAPQQTAVTVHPIVFVLAGLLVLAAVPGVVRALARGRRLRRVRNGAAGVALAWHEVMESARDLGFAVTSTATPRANADTLKPAAGADGSLGSLLAAIEGEAYSASTVTDRTDASAQARSLVGQLRGAVRPATRLRALLWPRTLVERIIRAIS